MKEKIILLVDADADCAGIVLGTGARTVMASQWPTPDDSGYLFKSFYKSLRLTQQGLSSASAADALRTAQIEMLHSGTWRSQPKFWAAFFVIGKD